MNTNMKRTVLALAIAAASFVAIFAFAAPFPLIVAIAAILGWTGAKVGLAGFLGGGGHGFLAQLTAIGDGVFCA